MSFTFLAPIFLAGLAALAAPIIVHLVNRERRNAVAFPSLMFLRRIPFRSVRRQRIRQWPLFLARCLALILIVAAFARPFFASDDTRVAASGDGPRDVVILLDRSNSMAYGNRWQRATEAAERALATLGGSDRGSLVLFDQEATVAAGPSSDIAALRAALRSAQPGAGSTRYAPALALAQQLIERAERPRREVVVISDFQRAGWDGQELPRLPSPAAIATVDVGDTVTVNALVAGVEVTRDVSRGVDEAIVKARLAHQGQSPISDARIILSIGGRDIETKRVSLPASGASAVAFTAVAVPDAATRGTVRLEVPASSDPLGTDNAFHFVIERAQVVSVLLIDHQDMPASRTMFLPRALGIGDQPAFRVTQRRADRVTPDDVSEAQAVVLHGATMPGGAVGARIRSLVEGGGGLLLTLGEHTAQHAATADMLPAGVGAVVDRSAERGGAIGSLDRSHPALESFRGARSGDFSSTRYFRYRAMMPAADAVVLARFDDGTVALAERPLGKGRVLMFGSTFDGYWNDLPVQPVFLPLVQSLVRHAAGWTASRAWHTVGQAVAIPDAQTVVVTPSGERIRRSAEDSARSLTVREQGFYEMRDANGVTARQTMAVNLDPAESELAAFAPEELARAVAPGDQSTTRIAGVTALSLEEREQRQMLWWYLLGLALLVLAVESMWSNRLSRTVRPGGGARVEGRSDHA